MIHSCQRQQKPGTTSTNWRIHPKSGKCNLSDYPLNPSFEISIHGKRFIEGDFRGVRSAFKRSPYMFPTSTRAFLGKEGRIRSFLASRGSGSSPHTPYFTLPWESPPPLAGARSADPPVPTARIPRSERERDVYLGETLSSKPGRPWLAPRYLRSAHPAAFCRPVFSDGFPCVPSANVSSERRRSRPTFALWTASADYAEWP